MIRLTAATRRFSNAAFKVVKNSNHFEINDKLKVSFAWLRDHCKSPEIYDARNNMKKIEMPENTEVSGFSNTSSQLEIIWKDGHKSQFCLNELQNTFKDKEEYIKPVLWTAETYPDTQNTTVDFDSYMNTNQGLKVALENLCIHGFCFVSDTPVSTEKGTNVISQRIGPLYNTTYGLYWELASKEQEKVSDASYGNNAIEPHTDATYLYPPSALQTFHCLQTPESGGGDTLLVDGFQVAEDFRQLYPEGFEFLATTPIEFRYLHTADEPHVHYRSKDVVFKLYPKSNDMMQIRVNGYRVFPQKIDFEAQLKFYKYYPILIDMAKDAKYVKKLSLKPGTVLITNNWRTLHGRTGFDGKRVLSGNYVGHLEFKSRCRTLGIPIRETFENSYN